MVQSRTLLLAFLALFVGGCYVPPKLPPEKEAPPFKGKAPADQKHYSLLDLLLKGPVLIVFLPPNCSPGYAAISYFELLAKVYEGKATVIGLYVDQEEPTAAWVQKQKPKFTVVPDVDHHIAEKYKMEFGPSAVLVNRNSEIIGRWETWSAASLTEINQKMAEILKVEPALVDTKSAPPSGPRCRLIQDQR